MMAVLKQFVDLPHGEGGGAPAGLDGGRLPPDRTPSTELLRGQE